MANRRRRQRPHSGAYVEGNTVRKLSVVEMPQRHQTEPARRKERHSSRRPAKRQAQVVHFNLGYVLALATCAALMLWIGTGYLQLQAQNSKSLKNIAALENQLSELKTENDDAYNRLAASIDLTQIRETAIYELGMIYADADQIVLYDNKINDYVRQYADIPEKEKTMLDKLLGK